MSSVGPISHLLETGLAVLAYEGDELRHRDVALLHRALAELLEVLGEGQATVLLLDHGAQHDDVERLQAQISEEARIWADHPVVLPVARELLQQLEHAVQHLGIHVGHDRGPSRGRVVATTRSPSRCVCATSRLSPTRTTTSCRSRSRDTIAGASARPGAIPVPSAFPTASLAHQQRKSHSSA